MNRTFQNVPRLVIYGIRLTLVLGFTFLSAFEGNAQPSEEVWSEIIRTDSQEFTRWTKIIPGPDDVLHAFWAVAEPEEHGNVYTSKYKTIFYANSSHGLEWSQPTDIIFDAFGIDDLDVVATDRGLNLFWNSDCVHHAEALYGQNMADAKNWVNNKTCTASRAIPDSLAATRGSVDGEIMLVLSIEDTLNGLVSTDHGESWEPPVTIATAQESGNAANTAYPAVFFTSQGTVYVAWSAAKSGNDNYENTGLFFARSEDGGTTWTTPIQLAEPGNTQPSIVAKDNGEVHVVWNTRVGMSMRPHKWSKDKGESWSDLFDVLTVDADRSLAGMQGAPDLTIDNNETIHLLLGTNTGVRYSQWMNGRWTQALHLGSLADGETWLTGLVAYGARLCAFWNAIDAAERGFSIACKGKVPDNVGQSLDSTRVPPTEIANDNSQIDNPPQSDLQLTKALAEEDKFSQPSPAKQTVSGTISPPDETGTWEPIAWGAGLAFFVVASMVALVLRRSRQRQL